MPKYLYVYHGGGGAPEGEDAQQAAMNAWMTWMGGLGNKLVDGGNPVLKSWTVGSGGVAHDGGPDPAMGYSIVEAASQDEAAEMAKGCPIVEGGGTVEVAEIMEM
ncbi:hypothetical protein HKCCE2091_00675 [Rhodobacterales bacterium HKCCE2091]|nr:hypothetical protein [Rhodobacterales bacterium HKCCE2091]